MKIIILGAGQVGASVAAALASENSDITVVDPLGKPLGVVTFRQLAGAMVNAHEANDRTMAIAATAA